MKIIRMNFHDYPFLSHAFGFGLMDAGRMVEMAEKWKLAPPQQKCSEEYNGGEGRRNYLNFEIFPNNYLNVEIFPNQVRKWCELAGRHVLTSLLMAVTLSRW